ncbi:dual OB domain-containing protein [Euhalothece natronophila]|nr:hypothetical protein [Euhalothece natronophila]
MSPLTSIICLANSWKHGDRCIAGINLQTGCWVRPISSLEDGRIPLSMRLINGKEPKLLDIIAIPLAKEGNDFGFESENLSVLPGEWRKQGEVVPKDILRYCQRDHYVLHNHKKYVTVTEITRKPFLQRNTLQLVYVTEFSVEKKLRDTGSNQYQATIVTANGQTLRRIGITDPVFVQKLDRGEQPNVPCLVTVSLSMPYRPDNWEGDDPCWKLLAGVIELEPQNNRNDDIIDIPF